MRPISLTRKFGSEAFLSFSHVAHCFCAGRMQLIFVHARMCCVAVGENDREILSKENKYTAVIVLRME